MSVSLWFGVGHLRLGGIHEVHGNWIIGENDLAEAPMSPCSGPLPSMAITPSVITKWVGVVAQVSRMLPVFR
jgi:hypothetical protein